MNKLRYTLHYLYERGEFWQDDYICQWQTIDFKTRNEAIEYLSIAGDKAYIIDNLTGKRIVL